MPFQHQTHSAGKWYALSLAEQLGNVGSEVGRAARATGDNERYWAAVSRAFELLDLTISDPRWKKRLKELVRAREVFGDVVSGGLLYRSTFEELDRYFYQFAYAARLQR